MNEADRETLNDEVEEANQKMRRGVRKNKKVSFLKVFGLQVNKLYINKRDTGIALKQTSQTAIKIVK